MFNQSILRVTNAKELLKITSDAIFEELQHRAPHLVQLLSLVTTSKQMRLRHIRNNTNNTEKIKVVSAACITAKKYGIQPSA